MQRAVNYIEQNLHESVAAEDAAAHLHYSKDYFQRMFVMVTGYTVGEYIRNRRLSLAAQDLAAGQGGVLEIALRYRYESPESFTKAFARLFGFTPSQLRANKPKIDYFYPLTIQTIIRGGFNMDKQFDMNGKNELKEHEINFTAMIPSRNDISGVQELAGIGLGSQEVRHDGDTVVIKTEGDMDCLQTADYYTLPLRIDCTAKTDGTNIRLFYNAGELILNWECNPDSLGFHDIIMGKGSHYEMERLPLNEFVDISWIIGKKHMEVLINGKSIFRHDSYPYIGMLMLDTRRKIIAPVRIGAAWGSTVTFKSLKVTELVAEPPPKEIEWDDEQ